MFVFERAKMLPQKMPGWTHELHVAHLCFGGQLLLASWHCHFGRAGLHANEGSTWMFSEGETWKKIWNNHFVHKDSVH